MDVLQLQGSQDAPMSQGEGGFSQELGLGSQQLHIPDSQVRAESGVPPALRDPIGYECVKEGGLRLWTRAPPVIPALRERLNFEATLGRAAPDSPRSPPCPPPQGAGFDERLEQFFSNPPAALQGDNADGDLPGSQSLAPQVGASDAAHADQVRLLMDVMRPGTRPGPKNGPLQRMTRGGLTRHRVRRPGSVPGPACRHPHGEPGVRGRGTGAF